MIPPTYWSPTKKLMVLGAMAGGKLVEDTATGNPLTFITDVSKPLKSLLVPFLPVQSGTGDPSPQNIRPILAWDGLKVWLSHETATFVQGGISDSSGINTTTNTRIRTDYIPVSVLTETANPVEIYGIGYSDDEPVIRLIHFYNGSKQWIGAISQDLIYRKSYLILDEQIPENAEYFRISAQKNRVGTDNISPDGIVLFINNQSETDISFPSPVYGGTLDVVSGVLTVTHVCDTLTWSDGNNASDLTNVTRKWFSLSEHVTDSTTGTGKYCDKAPFKNDYAQDATHFYTTVVNGASRAYIFLPIGTEGTETVQVVYPLATPQEITLTPEQITALVGDNTIWSDADGSMTAVYLKKG